MLTFAKLALSLSPSLPLPLRLKGPGAITRERGKLREKKREFCIASVGLKRLSLADSFYLRNLLATLFIRVSFAALSNYSSSL